MNHVCKCSHVCFLNCCHCEIAESATKEEKAQAKKDMAEYRKKYHIFPVKVR